MKNLKQFSVLTFFILSTLLLTRCENTEQNTATPDKSLEAVLSEMAHLGESEKKIVSFDIVYDKRSDSYSYANVEVIKESKKAIDFAKGADPNFKYAEGTIEVECTDAEGNVTVTNCPDYVCVGKAVAFCVETGGCAQVCKMKAQYYPSAITN